LDVVLIYRKDRSMTAAQRKFIEAIAAEARPEHMDAATSRPRSQSHIVNHPKTAATAKSPKGSIFGH
jgi:hypothetical protein